MIAATDRELAAPAGWRTFRCGVGPVDAAAATSAAIASLTPRLILHVGIAGARRRLKLSPASLVIGTASHYSDLTVPDRFAPSHLTPAPALVDAARRALPSAACLAIGTSARVGGIVDTECDIEAMEGFAVLRAAQLARIPAIEIRAISNDIEEPDRAKWQFDAAFAAITDATPRLVAELLTCVN